MNVSPSILAESDIGSFIGLIVILVFAGLSGLSKWLGNEKRQQEAREALERRRREQAENREPASPAAPSRQSTKARDVRRSYGAAGTGRRQASKPMPVAQIVGEQQVRVGEELRRQQERRSREDRHRQERLAEYQPPESDAAAIADRIVTVQPKLSVAVVEEHEQGELQVNLSDAAAARSAILFSEILSRPKALRESDEMWDT